MAWSGARAWSRFRFRRRMFARRGWRGATRRTAAAARRTGGPGGEVAEAARQTTIPGWATACRPAKHRCPAQRSRWRRAFTLAAITRVSPRLDPMAQCWQRPGPRAHGSGLLFAGPRSISNTVSGLFFGTPACQKVAIVFVAATARRGHAGAYLLRIARPSETTCWHSLSQQARGPITMGRTIFAQRTSLEKTIFASRDGPHEVLLAGAAACLQQGPPARLGVGRGAGKRRHISIFVLVGGIWRGWRTVAHSLV